MKRRHFTLLETLIAISLTTIILTTLLYFYQQMSILDIEYNKLQQESFERRYLENRFAEIFPKAVADNTIKKDFYFFTSPIGEEQRPSLVFTYDNGVKLDKVFSNHVLARLYIDNNKNLALAVWPSPLKWSDKKLPPMKKTILMPKVDALKFAFFIPPAKEEAKNDNKKLPPSPGTPLTWEYDKWQKDYKLLPGLIRITITKGDKTFTYSYPFPNSKPLITYTK